MSKSRRSSRNYVQGVIRELYVLGYSDKEARDAFLRHYRGLRRSYGFYLNARDFAKYIDDIERIMKSDTISEDSGRIYVGHLRKQLYKPMRQAETTVLVFNITKEMEKEINKWDTCIAKDVDHSKFAYVFVPTSIGIAVKVQCDVCKRELDLTDW
ncbi:hypothetical protein MHH60_13990 [Paenibacillus sp. FSL H7-0716]|uniref:Uncharacterized protein n=1 Tax=Paenibacillus odorifer TaxID=189426 RepID=A0AB36JKT7_9BACL|nr:hypothetical protein [Paenibacillus odorifer]OME23576.1 hypothetical protein BSK47_03745 [Paenibacillus odorifer]